MLNSTYPLVTIGIPTYNRADSYLKKAVQSAMSQTYQNIEIIVSDNCSADNTQAFISSFSDPRLRYFRHNKNIGANNNFNYCLEQAKGDYFLLFQDDDLIDCDFVDVCMKAANYDTDIGIIRTGTRKIDSKGKILSESPNMAAGLSTLDFFRCWFACKTSFYLCSTLFNTKRLKQLGGFASKHNLFQDVIAEVQLAATFGRVDVEDVKASFRKHDEELTFSVKVRDWCEDSFILLDLMCDLVPEEKTLVRSEGMRFLSTINYSFAGKVRPLLKRFVCYMTVFQSFRYRYVPPSVHRKWISLNRKLKQLRQ